MENTVKGIYFIGIEIPTSALEAAGIKPAWDLQKSLHVTLRYLGKSSDTEKRQVIAEFKELLGQEVDIRLLAEGFYKNENQGVIVEILDPIIRGVCINKTPHVTISINKDIGAESVNTKFISPEKVINKITKGKVVWVDRDYLHHSTIE